MGPPVEAAASRRGLADLLSKINEASAEGRFEEAIRWADRANRITPGNAALSEVLGRLYTRVGDRQRAIGHVREALQARPTPQLHAALIDLLFELKRERQGFSTLESALRRFAVEDGDDLSLCARVHTVSSDRPTPGWVGLRPDLKITGEIRAEFMDRLQVSIGGWSCVTTLAPFQSRDGNGYRFEATSEASADGLVSADSGGAVLVGSDCAFPPDFLIDGRARVEAGVLRGWVQGGWAPNRPPELMLERQGRDVVSIRPTQDPSETTRFDIEVDLAGLELVDGEVAVQVLLPGGARTLLPGSPSLITLPDTPRGTGERPIVRALRRRFTEDKVDVVVPVFRGREATLACLHSIRRHAEGVSELIVIDDASPDPRLKADLDQMASAGEITLLRNDVNLGFAASVNRGLLVHKERDTVILNSDTEVFTGWLSGLRKAAYSSSTVGTVTPLTNAGAIVSYPAGLGSPCTSEGAARIAQIASDVNPGRAIDTPTGVGFCWYVRQDCLAAVGLLDSACFGLGYGEENDFCMRARTLGWRHVIAPDVFVRHLEAQSFGQDRNALMDRNRDLLTRRHPEYEILVDRFIRSDPLLPDRRRIDERRLIDAAGCHVLLLTHALPGGVAHFLSLRKDAIFAEGAETLVLKAAEEGGPELELVSENATLTSLRYSSSDHQDLERLVRRLDVRRVEIHHVLDIPPAIIDLCYDLGVAVDIYVHDYSWICPRITLLGGGDRYCGEPHVRECDRCTAAFGSSFGPEWPAAELRERSGRWLSAATQVIVPTEDVRKRLEIYFPTLSLTLIPWEQELFKAAAAPAASDKPVKVCVIGAIGEQKGFGLLQACAEDAARRSLPLSFVVVGFTVNDAALEAVGNVFITGPYEEEEAQGLIAREAPDIVFFSSVTPETWCFTLSHAFRASLPVVALDCGAIAERTRDLGAPSALLPLESSPSTINDRLITLAGRSFEVFEESSDQTELSGEVEDEFDVEPGRMDGRSESLVEDPPLSKNQKPPASTRASIQVLTLSKGLYRFLVKDGALVRGEGGLFTLPAVQVSAAPGTPADCLEYMTSPGKDGAWLVEVHDTIILRVNQAETPIFITSYTRQGLKPLQIEIERMDGDRQSAPRAARRPPSSLANAPARGGLIGASHRRTEDGRLIAPTRILAHISGRGDVQFVDKPWIGDLDRKLPIEGFCIEPLGVLGSEDVEYKAISEYGQETSWAPGGSFCGTRQRAVALGGFAVRLRGEKAERYEVRYSAIYCSGLRVGPMADGTILRSREKADKLQVMEITFAERRDGHQGSGIQGIQEAGIEEPENQASGIVDRSAAPRLETRGRPPGWGTEPLDLPEAGAPAGSRPRPSPASSGPLDLPPEPKGVRSLSRPAPSPGGENGLDAGTAFEDAQPSRSPHAPERPRRSVGPRFSVFREDGV